MKSIQKSVKTRLIYSFVLVVFISVAVLELILVSLVRQYYYSNLEESLVNQVKVSADFYVRYLSNSTLDDNILDNVDVFWKQTTAQVQLIDISGELLMDSIGYMPENNILDTVDVNAALNGKEGKWVGGVSYDSAKVMAVSHPLIVDGEVIGVIRFISSVREVNKEIANIAYVFIAIGALVLVLSIAMSIFIANGIIMPIREVTNVARKMAEGNFNIRSKEKKRDEIGQLSDTLNYMAEEIVKREGLKNEFLSSVSHELRTPLTSIKGWAATLNTGELDDIDLLENGLNIIETESDRLTAMVEELLEFSKFASGKIKLNRQMVDMNTSVEYVKNHMNPLAIRNSIDLVLKPAEELSKIAVDEDRIKQVLINVIDNAIKFTPPGNEVVIATWQEADYVNISITDTGCGIDEQDLPKVKEKFFKGKNSQAQHGIGLSICDEIVSLHGGDLVIESELGQGTKVTIKLPVRDEI